jgi:hypothetical protein
MTIEMMLATLEALPGQRTRSAIMVPNPIEASVAAMTKIV